MRRPARSLLLLALAAVVSAAAVPEAGAAPPRRAAAASGGSADSRDAIVERVEWEASEAGGRIVVVVRGEAGFSTHAASPDPGAGLPARAYVDLRPARLGPKLARSPIPVGDGILQRIRIGQFDRQTVRVVVDLAEPAVFDVRTIDRPARLLLTLRPRSGAMAAARGQIAAPATEGTSEGAASATTATAASPAASTEPGAAAPDAVVGRAAGTQIATAEPAPPAAPIPAVSPGLVAALPPQVPPLPQAGGSAPRTPTEVEGAHAGSGREPVPAASVPPAAEPPGHDDSRNPAAEGEAAHGSATASHAGAVAAAAPSVAPADRAPGAAPVVAAVAPTPAVGAASGPAPSPAPRARGAGRAVARPRVVVLDPGHGGKDPGARGVTGDEEKMITLAIAELVAERLRPDQDLRVVLTRTDDRTVSLEQRTAVANAQAADLFVSIHANASENVALAGIETYTLNNTNDRATIRLAAMENGLALAGASPSEPDLAYILSDLLQTGKEDESVALAESIHGETVRTLRSRWKGVSSLGVKKGPFYVLVGAYMPCVLVEVGFLSHETEGQRVASRRYQRDVAEGIARGIRRFLGSSSANANL